MGLLDDAIREHLDLKRRRGADPAELERLEREALGPVRRGPEETELAEPAPDQRGYDFELEPELSAHFDEHAMPDFPLAYPESEPGSTDEPFDIDAPGEGGSLPRTPIPPPGEEPGIDASGQETAEYDIAGDVDRQRPASDDDVLEGTPEFLQDTPDHDRLWFEQRPPRDFDFNG